MSNSSIFSVTQFNALYDLYMATNGANWIWSNNYGGIPWDFSQPDANPCTDSWQGIICFGTTTISELSLSGYNLDGTLPNTIGQLNTLFEVDLSENSLRGTIPSQISNWTGLFQLSLNDNEFTGNIPNEIYSYTGLFYLDLSYNRLDGNISSLIGNLPSYMFYLALNNNFLTGSLPSSLGKITGLQSASFSNNLLYGTIPNAFYDWSSVDELDLSSNEFTGRLNPWFMQNYSNIDTLDFHMNQFTGPIPIRTWYNLGQYIADQNYLSGEIQCPSLVSYGFDELGLSYNYLSGTLPSCLMSIPHISVLDVQANMLTGTLSSTLFGNLTSISAIYLDNNYFYGTIPSTITAMYALFAFTASYNYLSGTIPRVMSSMPYIGELLLEGNQFTGKLDELFTPLNTTLTPRAFPNLIVIDLSNNQLSGSIPNEFFINNYQINSFAIASNCLTGTIPGSDTLCTATNLIALSLDGLSTATSCRISIFHDLHVTLSSSTIDFDAFTLHYGKTISGSIPMCLFTDLPVLRVLHLSGNALTGSLPSSITLSHSLSFLSLSHNRLTGTIPSIYLNRYWTDLDLSYNRFTGNLQSFSPLPDTMYTWKNVSLSLQVNRLSGPIPNTLRNAYSINILNGNMFDCNDARTDLPTHDSDTPIYSCGSDDVNNSLYLWLGCWVIPLLVWLLIEKEVIRREGGNSSTYGSRSVSGSRGGTVDGGSRIGSWRGGGGGTGSSMKQKRGTGASVNTTVQSTDVESEREGEREGESVIVTGRMQSLEIIHPNTSTSRSPSHSPSTDSDSVQVVPRYNSSYRLSQWRWQYNKFLSLFLWQQVFTLYQYKPCNHHTILGIHNTNPIGTTKPPTTTTTSTTVGGSGSVGASIMRLSNCYLFHQTMNEVRRCTFYLTIIILFLFLPVYGVLTITSASYQYQYAWQISAAFVTGRIAGIILWVFFGIFIVFVCYQIFVLVDRLDALAEERERVIDNENSDGNSDGNNEGVDSGMGRERQPSRTLDSLFSLSAFTLSDPNTTVNTKKARLHSKGLILDDSILSLSNSYRTSIDNEKEREGNDKQHDNNREGEKQGKTENDDNNLLFTTCSSMCSFILSIDYLLYFTWIITLLINLIVMLSLDSVYIYIVLNYSGSTVTLTQLALAGSKLLWNETLVFHLLFQMKWLFLFIQRSCIQGYITLCRVCCNDDNDDGNTIVNTNTNTNATDSANGGTGGTPTRRIPPHFQLSVRDVTVLSLISIINKIVAPCIAIALVNSNCFYNALFAAPAVTAEVKYCNTHIAGLSCVNLLASGENGKTYNPPFLYSYQCSSFFLTDYAPVFVYMFAFSSILMPFILFCLQNLHDSLADDILYANAHSANERDNDNDVNNNNNDNGENGEDSKEKRSVDNPIIGGNRREREISGASASSSGSSILNDSVRGTLAPRTKELSIWSRWLYKLLSDWLPQTWQCPHSVSTSKEENRSRLVMIVNTKQRTVIRINNHFALLLTFAILFPPLSLIAMISICILTYFEERNTSRLLHHAYLYKKVWLAERIERECNGIMNSFRYTMTLIILLSVLLFGFFIFDTIEDSIPAWIFISVFLCIIIVLFIIMMKRISEREKITEAIDGMNDDDVMELDTFKSSLIGSVPSMNEMNDHHTAVNPMVSGKHQNVV